MSCTKFFAVAAAALCLVWAPAEAQQSRKVHRIGVLETISSSLNAANLDALRKGLKELGYVEGENLVLDYKSADGEQGRFAGLAAELVQSKVDLIVTRGTPAALAAKQATSSIPVVMAVIAEPIGPGAIGQLARPGGNVTGLSSFATELQGKRVEIMKEMLPGMKKIGALLNMANPVVPAQWEETKTAAAALNIGAELLDVRSGLDIEPAI